MTTMQAPSTGQTFQTKGGKIFTPNSSGLITNVGGQSIVELLQMGCTIVGSGQRAIRKITANPAAILTTDDLVELNFASPAPPAVSLPVMSSPGGFTIYDGAGNLQTYNATVTPAAGLINGAGTFVMASNYQSSTFNWDGSNWGVI